MCRPLLPTLLLCLLACAVPAQDRLVLVVGKGARAEAAAGLEAGIRAALEETDWKARLEVARSASEVDEQSLEGAAGCLLFLSPARTRGVQRLALAAGVPCFDLGQADVRGEGVLRPVPDPDAVVEAAAWWLTGPLAHHRIAVYHGRDRSDRDLARAFEDLVEERHEGCVALRPQRIPGRARALAKPLERERIDGVTAYFCAGTPEEARRLATAARTVSPPPVVLVAPRALAFDAPDGRDGPVPLLPEGTVVLDRDLPDGKVVEELAGVTGVLSMEGPGGPWTLMAFDAALALRRALEASDGDRAAAAGLLAAGKAEGTRGPFARVERPPEQGALRFLVLMMDGGRLRPFPPLITENPQPRPKRPVYALSGGLGTFSQWSTRTFRPVPGTTLCRFTWGGPKVRTIDEDLKKLLLSTEGRLPALDHLVREKLMTRLMSVTAEKFLLGKDGTPRPGESLGISMVFNWESSMKRRAKKVWPVFVAGDDPEAGGRAFGSYCFVYSTHIYRTIFKKYQLFDEGEKLGLGDLTTLTGLGRDKEREYVLGSREDILYRLIENYAGSMALTAAHEVGHLAGLGHDTDDPHGIMNVEEGAGISHHEGHFTEKNLADLTTTLGRIR